MNGYTSCLIIEVLHLPSSRISIILSGGDIGEKSRGVLPSHF